MDLGIKGKNAIVTGGSKGIGRATALALAKEGANVAICARGTEALEKADAEISQIGVSSYKESCDIGDSEALARFLNNARQSLGSVDILINNPSGFGMTDDEDGWKASVDVDLMGTVRATQQVIPWMEETGGGSVVHISSISGLEPGSPAPYAAVKAALFNHAKTTAQNVAEKNIRVNCVAPGSIFFEGGVWDFVKKNDKPTYDAVVGGIPFGRMGTPEEVADVIVFIASPRSAWVSGATLVVDGVQHKGIY